MLIALGIVIARQTGVSVCLPTTNDVKAMREMEYQITKDTASPEGSVQSAPGRLDNAAAEGSIDSAAAAVLAPNPRGRAERIARIAYLILALALCTLILSAKAR